MTREEAIEQLKKWSLPKETMELLEALSPGLTNELAESEDEKIIRAINNMLPFIPDEAYANNGVTKEDVLIWLEKQKEQKSVDSMALSEDGFTPKDVFRFNLASCLYNYGKTVAAKCLGTHILDEDLNDYVTNDDVNKAVEKSIKLLRKNACEQKPGTTPDNPIDPFDTKLFQDGVKEGRRLEREDIQKEQKPILFIPKFRVGDKVRSAKNSHLTYDILEVGHINELGNPEYKVEIFTDGKPDEPRNIKFIECQKMDSWGELIEQKPAGCGEGILDEFTENIRSLITDKLTYHDPNGSGISSIVFIDDKTAKDIANGVLFYVGKEVTKNPNKEIPEWSKEDEKMLKNILYVLESYVSKTESMVSPSLIASYPTYHKEIDWLKSLRPQPKQDCKDCMEYEKGYSRGHQEGHTAGYNKGYKEATEEYNKQTAYHFDFPYPRSCYEGGRCTNPQMDCINCPRKDSGGASINTVPNTTSGASNIEPRWKPSEEQMKALNYALQVMNTDLSPIAARTYQGLQEIQQNLRKLM